VKTRAEPPPGKETALFAQRAFLFPHRLKHGGRRGQFVSRKKPWLACGVLVTTFWKPDSTAVLVTAVQLFESDRLVLPCNP
jgi:hypothetical protein